VSLNIQEVKIRELTEEEIKRLIDEILKNPDKYKTEAKLLLTLRTDFRRGGCGYLYLYSNDFKVLYGEVDKV
jgi:ribosomal protein S13